MPRMEQHALDVLELDSVRRLVAGTGMQASDFVRFFDTTQTDFERDREGWIRFPYGRRLLGLRKRNKRCIFLDGDNRCTAYDARPITCRTFPFMIDLDDNGTIENVEMNTGIRCGCPNGVHVSISRLRADARREDREDTAYYRKLRRWNNNGHTGGKETFLEFLGF